MKILIKIALASLLLFNCNKDESSLNDYDLWGRLASKNGTWSIESLTTKNSTTTNGSEAEVAPGFEFVHFYIRTSGIGSVTIDVHTASFYNGDNANLFDCQAEEQRVVFQKNQVFGGEVWTVKENKRNKQVWTFTSGGITKTMTLIRCNCDIPKVQGTEKGG